MPFFSIVIPVYCTEQYLPQCLESVCCQTFQDFEIVIVNDGSPDASYDFVENFISNHPTMLFKHLRQENRGLLQARRQGFAHCRGEYILSLDSDDALATDALAIIRAAAVADDADIVVFNCCRTESFSDTFYKKSLEGLFEGEKKSDVYSALLSPPSNLVNMCLKAFKNSLLDDCEDYAKYGRVQFGEDLMQSAELLTLAERITCIDEPLYYYRINEESIAATFNSSRYSDVAVVHSRVMEYANQWDELYPGHGYSDMLARADLLSVFRQLETAAAIQSAEEWKEFADSVFIDDFYTATVCRTRCSNLPRFDQMVRMMLFEKRLFAPFRAISVLSSQLRKMLRR